MELPRTIMAHLPRSKEHDNGGLQFMFSASSSSTTIPKVTVKVVTLVNDTMRDQIAAIRQADVLLANHGAGLTHLLFLDQGAHVIELSCNHDFFVQLAKWHSSGDSSSQRLQHYCQDFVDGGATISDQFWNNNVVSVIANRVLHLDNP
jgi:Glycosyltransferase 61